MNEQAQKRLSEAVEKGLCVACLEPLGNAKVVRGCHERCYRATVRAIQRKDFSEQERIDAGKLLPPKSGGGQPTNPVTIEARSFEHPPPGATDTRQMEPCNHYYGVDDDLELNSHLEFVQAQILRLSGVSLELEDILWHFFRTAERDMSICTEVIVETANDLELLESFSRNILFNDPRPQK